MKLKYLLAATLISLCAAPATQAQQLQKNVMSVYDQMLRENYKDYEVLFRRANVYYNNGDYLRALDDLESAVKYTPDNATNAELLFEIYALRAECYVQLHRYTLALPEINSALKYDAQNYNALLLRADIEFELGDYSAAKADYSRLQRINSRSQESLFGLAKVAVKENNFGLANEYIEKAVALTPNKSSVFVKRAEVKKLMNDHTGAVDDLLVAIATDSSDSDALNQLVDMANTNYSAVMTGLSNAIKKAPNNPLYYFLRGSIAAGHYHYLTAIDDFKYIIDNNLYNYSGLYASLAECYYALGDYDTALENIESAIAKQDSQLDNVAHYQVVRSRIYRAISDYAKALSSAERALEYDSQSSEATVQKALVLTSQNQANEASALLGEVIMTEPYEPMNYLLRAWVLNDFMRDSKAATGFYNRVIDLELDHSEQLQSMLGFAQLFSGQTAKATAWMENCLSEPDYDGRINYYGACFYAWAGQSDKALACAEKALSAGYANYYDWTANNNGRINVAPLRDLPAFNELLQRHSSIFGR